MSMVSEQSYHVGASDRSRTHEWTVNKGHRACVECRRKKTRCDMRQPICGLCERTGGECTFPAKRKTPEQRRSIDKESQRLRKQRLERLMCLIETRFDDGQSLDDFTSPTPQRTREDVSPESNRSAGIWIDSLGTETRPLAPRSQAEEASSHISTESSHSAPNDCAPANEPQTEQIASGYTLGVHGELAKELIDLYFDKIQAWLPMLHRPRFCARYMDGAAGSLSSSRNYTLLEALLFNGMFALSARYSSHPYFGDTPPPKRGDLFAERAKLFYEKAQIDADSCGLLYLQGCILLASFYYTCGPAHEGWILTGVCVRLAYALDLSNMDEGEATSLSADQWIQKEELRRAWWLVWELDAFGSTVSRRPYAIDRRRMAVLLPVSDEAWFSGAPVQSALLRTKPGEAWKSLHGCQNQDVRAWFLVANYVMALAVDLLQAYDVSDAERQEIVNSFTCLALSLPQNCRLDTGFFCFDPDTYSYSNWVIDLQLMLVTARTVINALNAGKDGGSQPQPNPHMIREPESSRVIFHWNPDFIALSHPFIACKMLPPYLPSLQCSLGESFSSASHDIFKLVLGRYAEVWKLGAALLEVGDIIDRQDRLTSEELAMAKVFAVYFPPSITRIGSPACPPGPALSEETTEARGDIFTIRGFLPPIQNGSLQVPDVPNFSSQPQTSAEEPFEVITVSPGNAEVGTPISRELRDPWNFTLEDMNLDNTDGNLDYFFI